MARVMDSHTVLAQAAGIAEQTWETVTRLELAADADDLHESLTGSPLQPFWIDEADSLLFYTLTKTALLLGVATGTGFMISRLPSEHPTLIRWSAPAFVKIRLASLGLSLGRQTVRSFTSCMSSAMRVALYQQGQRHVVGLEAGLSCGGLQHKADLIAVPTTDLKTCGINCTSGALADVSFAWGALTVDDDKNALVYGPGVTPLHILHGGVAAPREMQALYGALNAVVSRVERVSPPARVSASLERFSTGFDPERRMVLKDGSVVAEEAPKDR